MCRLSFCDDYFTCVENETLRKKLELSDCNLIQYYICILMFFKYGLTHLYYGGEFQSTKYLPHPACPHLLHAGLVSRLPHCAHFELQTLMVFDHSVDSSDK